MITSRNKEWSWLANRLEVEVLNRAESKEFLTKRTGEQDDRILNAVDNMRYLNGRKVQSGTLRKKKEKAKELQRLLRYHQDG